MIDRRLFVAALPVLLAARPLAPPPPLALDAAVKAAESATGGRVGLAVLDTATGRRYSHRGTELFPMASTFKMLLVAAVLSRVDRREDQLDRAIPVTAGDMVSNSPFSEKRVGKTATVAELSQATIIYSDNAAANLLLPAIGGPAGLTKWLRGLGDSVTRLDRYETMLGEARPGDPRDTTSPDSVAHSWQKLLLGDALSPASRARLIGWLLANTTGGTRLRAGIPAGWKIGDKTGSANNNSINDIAVFWPPGAESPVIMAVFLNGGTASADTHFRVHADLARAVVAAL